MICERVKEQIPEYLAGMMEEGARERLLAHLDDCVACREEVARLDIVWRKLETLPAPEPSIRMRERFGDVLAAYEYGRQAKRPIADARRCSRAEAASRLKPTVSSCSTSPSQRAGSGLIVAYRGRLVAD